MTIDVIIPTCNPGNELLQILGNLERQTIKPNKIFIMNTITGQCNVDVFNATYKVSENIEIRHLESKDFDHANTRNDGARLSNADYLLFLTQDAIPTDSHLLENLARNHDENVIVSFGQQIADKNNKLEYLARAFNYKPQSYIKSEKDKKEMGIKVLFCSNACAMYNRKAFWELNGFNSNSIFNEDMLFAYKVIKSGYSIAYESDAKISHTHHYTCWKVLNRYFDQGVSQKDNEKIFKEFSSLGEGQKQAKYIIGTLWKEHDYKNLVTFVAQSASKLVGFFLGKHYTCLPKGLCKKLSLNKNYWK
ncbi:MAG: glycosyltransferase [Paludibacteraceae bacterium]|nr:glycosyltransferase [Paludibacteraceae bacterium]